jgi:hypothetical protein
MGGQACILYGGAEFSRDVDFAVALSAANLHRLRKALSDLRAEPVFFPPLSAAVLRRGHACHFRCGAAGVKGLRIDVMSRMRGAAPFSSLWRRRTEVRIPGVGPVPIVSLPDLVRIKKTQRDKDWIMIRRMLEADFAAHECAVDASRLAFWFSECRTPALLMLLAKAHPIESGESLSRPAVLAAVLGNTRAIEKALRKEEARERDLDRRYWAPLRRELEAWRLGRRATGRSPGSRA